MEGLAAQAEAHFAAAEVNVNSFPTMQIRG
jgi:hypothetical protein